MNTEANKPTVGQTFASRWLVRKYGECKKARGRDQPGIPEPEDLCHEISEAVDVYVERKVNELRDKLRAVAVEAADGKVECKDQVAFSSEELLQDQALLSVAEKWRSNLFSPIKKFPV